MDCNRVGHRLLSSVDAARAWASGPVAWAQRFAPVADRWVWWSISERNRWLRHHCAGHCRGSRRFLRTIRRSLGSCLTHRRQSCYHLFDDVCGLRTWPARNGDDIISIFHNWIVHNNITISVRNNILHDTNAPNVHGKRPRSTLLAIGQIMNTRYVCHFVSLNKPRPCTPLICNTK